MKKRVICLLSAFLLTMSILFSMIVPAYAADKVTDARGAVNGIVLIACGKSGGTGFAIGEEGKEVQYIVTAYHVIEDHYTANKPVVIWFSYASNDAMEGEVYVANADKDLAIIRLPEKTTKRSALKICPSKKVNIDDSFTALGYPGTATEISDFVKYDTSDVVITKGGIAKSDRYQGTDVYLFDGTVAQGNSGGPLVNTKGEVIGICKGNYTDYEQLDKRNYFINSDELLSIIDRDKIDIDVVGELTDFQQLCIIIAAAALVIILIVVVIIVVSKKKKNSSQPAPVVQVPPVPPIQNPQPIPVNPIPTNGVSNARITGKGGIFDGKSFPVSGKTLIGRDEKKCAVAYPHDEPGVSAVHCEIYAENGYYYLKDCGSSYGTFLKNGEKLAANTPVRLQNGSIFFLAGETNSFEFRN